MMHGQKNIKRHINVAETMKHKILY